MEIKDLAGLSRPLTRLIEVVSQGVGAVARPYLVRKNADAKAYAVKAISGALGEVAEKHQLPVLVKEEGIEVWQRPEDKTLRLDLVPVEDRMQSRTNYQERKRQRNLEQITAVAASELADEQAVADEAPDEDWVSRFFSAAQDVSSDQMQELWGRILAGEIRRPRSFSLRTLDFVRNLTKADAETLEQLADLAVTYGDKTMVPVVDQDWLQRSRSVFPASHFALSELGAMYPTDLTFRTFMEEHPGQTVLTSGHYVLLLDMQPPVHEVQLDVWKFTQVGREVIELIAPSGDAEHLEKVGRHYADRGVSVRLAKIVERLPDGRIRFDLPVEIKRTGS